MYFFKNSHILTNTELKIRKIVVNVYGKKKLTN
jgi:hypothetical protein